MNETMKKVWDITTKVLTYLLTAFTVFMMIFTIFTVSTVDKNDRNFFGFRFYIVQTDSMSKSENNADLDVHFNAGDIIIVKEVEDKTALEAGDIITFLSTNDDSYGETITHMIREREYHDSGAFLGYVTYGTNTGVNDEKIVEPTYIIGEYAGKLPGVGRFFAFVKTTPGYIVCILVPFLLLILYNGVNVIRLFKQYRGEQMSAMQAEKEKIEADRAENLRMMEELMALKEQLMKQQSAPAEESPVAEPQKAEEQIPEPVAEESPVEPTDEPEAEEAAEQTEEAPTEAEEAPAEPTDEPEAEEAAEQTEEAPAEAEEETPAEPTDEPKAEEAAEETAEQPEAEPEQEISQGESPSTEEASEQ